VPIIEPFNGLRYDAGRVGTLSRVVTPPYDVISPEGQARYYRLHPFNFVRVVFGKAAPADTSRRNRYSRAKETLEGWIREGILKFDPEPCLYPYLQEYRLNGRPRRRWGVVALVRLDSPRIYPHEETREGPKLDRYRLLQTVEASLSPIFGLIPDSRGEYQRFIMGTCRNRKPIAVARLGRVKHSLWRNCDPAWHKKLKAKLISKELVIADGHHRFEAALAFRNARKRKDPRYSPEAPYNFAMFYLAAAGTEEPGLLPTHRLVKRFPHQALDRLLRKEKFRGNIQPAANLKVLGDRLRGLRRNGRVGLGLYTGNGSSAYLLTAPKDSSCRLDVEWLHQEVLPRAAGSGAQISYTQDLLFARRQLRGGKAQALFLVQPPPLREVFRRARTALRMPGKTTYFHPKPLAGLVEYKFGSR